MADENKKDFNAMLNDSKDMPKFQTITDEKSIVFLYSVDGVFFVEHAVKKCGILMLRSNTC